MTKLCKQYIKEVKMLFPIMGQQEKTYLKNLEVSVEDCIEETHSSSMKELYEDFGTPTDVLASYLSSADIGYITQHVKKKVYIKRFFLTFFVAVLIIVGLFSYRTYMDCQTLKANQIFFEETVIE